MGPAPSSSCLAMTARSIRFFSPVWNQLFKKAWRSTRSSGLPSMSRCISSTTLSWVRVPVLSVQRMSTEPRFWMAFRFLMMTFWRLISKAPLAREVVTIMGSISGVRPTATEMANSSASIQLPLVKPFSSSTIGTITAMNRISSRLTLPMPLSKAVLGGLLPMVRAMEPNMVPSPTATATARALPLMTVLP